MGLQAALEEADGALEAEENKVLRAQLELGQVRQEIDRRMAEKEEEFNNTRKNHHRATESMQASLETEQRAKAETLRLKKKLEGQINELEIALDHANKANNEAQKSIKFTRDNCVRLNAAMRRLPESARRWPRRPTLLTAEPRPSLVRWRRLELSLTLLSVAKDKLRLN